MKTQSNWSVDALDYVVDWIRAVTTFLGALIARPREVASVVPSSKELKDGLSKLVKDVLHRSSWNLAPAPAVLQKPCFVR